MKFKGFVMVLKQVLSMMVGSTCFFFVGVGRFGRQKGGWSYGYGGGAHREGFVFVSLSGDKMS